MDLCTHVILASGACGWVGLAGAAEANYCAWLRLGAPDVYELSLQIDPSVFVGRHVG